MAKQTSLEKEIAILAKLKLDKAIEDYHNLGIWLHSRIETQQKELGEVLNKYQAEKEKIKK